MYYYDKNGIRVRKTNRLDIKYLKNNLRQADKDEVWKSHHHSAEEAVKLSYEQSIFSLTVENGRPICIFGVTVNNVLDEKATIWLLATDDLKKIKKRFVKNCRYFISMFLSAYPYLENYIDKDNVETIKWLKYLGATIEEAKPYGVEGQDFHHFYFKRG